MNSALLAKWLFRFYDSRVTGTWKLILIDKYCSTGQMRTKSSLWSGILKTIHLVHVSSYWKVGNGKNVRFWLDKWHGEIVLFDEYPNLFQITYNKYITVHEVLSGAFINLEFARQLHGDYLIEWCSLVNQYSSFSLTNIPDQILWRWTPHGNFTVH